MKILIVCQDFTFFINFQKKSALERQKKPGGILPKKNTTGLF